MVRNIVKVSVIMAAYNEENCVSRAIGSILNQTFHDFEFIIIDDGSTDRTREIVEHYRDCDQRIIIISKENTGLADSLNVGLKRARGEYIARIDADDESSKIRIETQVNFLDTHSQVALVGSWCYINHLNSIRQKKLILPTRDYEIKKFMQKDCPIVHSSVLFRRKVIEIVGDYNKVICEDYDYWIRIGRLFEIRNIPEFLVTRYENNNIQTRDYYKNISLRKIYYTRLKNQLRAVVYFGFHRKTLPYLTRTAINLFLSFLGLKK